MNQLHNYIHATDINDAWFKTLWEIWEKGRAYYIDKGSYAGEHRIGFDAVTIEIDYPTSGNIVPVLSNKLKHLTPITEEKALNYAVNYILGTEVQDNELYTYGSRINMTLQEVINKFNKGGPGNNQCIIQVGQPYDIFLEDPPCLRHIDVKIIEGYVNLYFYFRSWEAFAGLPTNLAGLKYLLDYLMENLNIPGTILRPGKFICQSKCLHIYSHMIDVVDQVLGFPKDRRTKEEVLPTKEEKLKLIEESECYEKQS